jgi:hypothetical protein
MAAPTSNGRAKKPKKSTPNGTANGHANGHLNGYADKSKANGALVPSSRKKAERRGVISGLSSIVAR